MKKKRSFRNEDQFHLTPGAASTSRAPHPTALGLIDPVEAGPSLPLTKRGAA